MTASSAAHRSIATCSGVLLHPRRPWASRGDETDLEALGYKYVGLLEPNDDDGDDDADFYFHVERIETHLSESLFERCEELSSFARRHELESFDDFDVGNLDGSILYP